MKVMSSNEHEIIFEDLLKNNWKQDFIETYEGDRYTYADFFTAAFAFANVLKHEYKVEPGQVVALLLPNSVEVLVLYMATLFAEAIVAPIDFLAGEEDLRNVLQQVNPKCVISTRATIPFNVCIVSLSDVQDKAERFKVELSYLDICKNIDYKRPFLVTFTSGSTGLPKGVVHSFQNLFKSAYAFGSYFRLSSKHKFYHNLPMNYMAGILNLFILPLVWGCKIALGKRFSIEQVLNFWEPIRAFGANTFWFIPTIIALLLKTDRAYGLTEIPDALGFVGTAPLNLIQKQDFEKKYAMPLFESYGLSELLFISSNSIFDCYVPNSVGKLLPQVECIKALDGELLIKTPWSFIGYWNLSSKNFFEEGFYKTGDIGNLKEDYLFITDRKKDLIIRGGLNISPKAIENILYEIKIIDECTIIGLPDDILGEKITCFYVKKDQLSRFEKKYIADILASKIGKAYHIDEFIHLDSLPKTSNGKIDKISIKKLSIAHDF